MSRIAAKDLAAKLLKMSFPDSLNAAHFRHETIDYLILNEMGSDVRRYWQNTSIIYKCMIRKRIWDRAMWLLKGLDRAASTD